MSKEWKHDNLKEQEFTPLKDEERDYLRPTMNKTADFIRNVKEIRVGAGAKSFRADDNGIWLGSEQFATAPFRVTMAGALTATSVTITGLTTTFRQASIPTATASGDIWFDSDDSDKQYVATNAGDDQITAGEWERVDVGANPTLVDALQTTNAPADASATAGATFGSDIAGGGTANTQVGNDGYATLFRQTIFGNGADGLGSITSNTNLTSDMYYTNLTISNNSTLSTKGYKIFYTGTLTVDSGSKISGLGNDGGVGGAGTGDGGTGGTGGTAISGTVASIAGSVGGAGGIGGNQPGVAGTAGSNKSYVVGNSGVAGGAGGAGGGTGAGGGGGGTATASKAQLKNAIEAISFTDYTPAGNNGINPGAGSGGGGGGGGGGGTGNGGGGGGGAGATGIPVLLFGKTLINNGTIESDGGVGGDGGAGSAGAPNAGGGGGGGGGNGGLILSVHETATIGSTSISGGVAGSGGAAGGVGAFAGSNGTAGNSGTLIEINI